MNRPLILGDFSQVIYHLRQQVIPPERPTAQRTSPSKKPNRLSNIKC